MTRVLITALCHTALLTAAVLPLFGQASDVARREVMYRRYLEFPNLIEGDSIEPHWTADGQSFWYAHGDPDSVVIYEVDPRANTKEPLFDIARLRRAVASELGHEPSGKGVPFDMFTLVDGESTARFTVDGVTLKLDLETYATSRLRRRPDFEPLGDWTHPRIVRRSTWVGVPPFYEVPSPDGRWLLLDRAGDLWLRSASDNQMRQLTTNGEPDYGWQFPGALWSPDSRKIATRRVDERGLTKSPLVHWLGPKETIEWWYYPDPGDPLPQSELFIIDVYERRQLEIDTGDKRDLYFTYLGWLPDGSEVLFTRQDRAFKTLELLAADAVTGKTRSVLTERLSTFVDFKGYRLLPDSRRFLWISERDGWAHLYLYDLQGNLIRQLTRGEFPVLQVIAVDEEGDWVYFTAHAEPRVYDTHLYRVRLDGSGFGRLTEGSGQHHARFSPSLKYFLDTHSSIDRPPTVELRAANGSLLQVLDRARIDALTELKWKPPEEFTVKAADGETDLYGYLYKPADFDPAKQYPVIDHIYAGPQTTWPPRTFNQIPHGVFPQALAQMGFIVFMVDARGTPERSKTFQDVVYGQLGRNEIPDHVAALRQLAAERPFMDLSRVGIFGNSWGGYFTLRAMLLAPEVYHAGVAGAPVSDVTQFLGHERYLGLPEANAQGYEYGSNSKIAHRLQGKLLITIGTSDQNVRFAFTMKMAEALIRADKYFDLIVMPERTHHYGYTKDERPWREREYFIEAIRRHFVKYLLGERP